LKYTGSQYVFSAHSPIIPLDAKPGHIYITQNISSKDTIPGIVDKTENITYSDISSDILVSDNTGWLIHGKNKKWYRLLVDYDKPIIELTLNKKRIYHTRGGCVNINHLLEATSIELQSDNFIDHKWVLNNYNKLIIYDNGVPIPNQCVEIFEKDKKLKSYASYYSLEGNDLIHLGEPGYDWTRVFVVIEKGKVENILDLNKDEINNLRGYAGKLALMLNENEIIEIEKLFLFFTNGTDGQLVANFNGKDSYNEKHSFVF
jgi:hypothetical protein